MINPKSPEIGGKLWPEFVMSLICDPYIRPNPASLEQDFLSAKLVLILKPMRRDDNGKIIVLNEAEYFKTIIIDDLFASNNFNLLQAVGATQEAIQQYINSLP